MAVIKLGSVEYGGDKVRNGKNDEKDRFATQDVRQEACERVGENTKNTGHKFEHGRDTLSGVTGYCMDWRQIVYHQCRPT